MGRISYSLAALFVCALATTAGAQDARQAVVSYSYLRNGGTGMHGWKADGGVDFVGVSAFGDGGWAALGLDVSVSNHTGRADGPGASDVRRTSVLAGLRLTGDGLFPGYLRAGLGMSQRAFDEAGADGVRVRRSRLSPVVQAGGGVWLPLGRHVVLRPVQVDYQLFPTDPRARHGVQVSTGIGIGW